jgi:hypothetical protein
MKKFLLIILLMFASGGAILGQHDDVYSYNQDVIWHKMLTEKLGLRNLSDCDDDFIFRFWNKGQVVDITLRGDTLQGSLTSYFYRSYNDREGMSRKDTIFVTIALDAEKVKSAYASIIRSGILDIPSDSLFDGWITDHLVGFALIGHKNSGSEVVSFFSAETYRTEVKEVPFDEAEQPEELNFEELIKRSEIIDQFIIEFSEILDLQAEYRMFEKSSMRSAGCYVKEWESKSICIYGMKYFAGYYGSKVTPIGIYGGVAFGTSGAFLSKSSMYLRHMVDLKGSYDFHSVISRREIFSPISGEMRDLLKYIYRQVSSEGESRYKGRTIHRHQIQYGIFLSALHLNIAAGPSYLAGEIRDLGAVVELDMHPFAANLAFQQDQIDYRFSFTPRLILDSYKPFSIFDMGIIYERFRAQKGWQFYVGVVF